MEPDEDIKYVVGMLIFWSIVSGILLASIAVEPWWERIFLWIILALTALVIKIGSEPHDKT